MHKKNDAPLKIMVIKTKNKVYVSDNLDGSSYYYSNNIKGCLFDGEPLKDTYRKDWYEVSKVPTKIERKIPASKTNMRYELREGFQETELTPKVINESYIDEDSSYYEVKGLYEQKYELVEEGLEEVPFELNVVAETDEDFEIVKEDYQLKFSLLDRIQVHPVLLPTKPCALSKEDTYRIIRSYIKENIDPKHAAITSDYDFCLTVVKKIPHDPEEYTVNINASYPRRKAKYEKRYKRSRSVEVYNAAPKPYQSYKVVTPFMGNNYEDLQNNIKAFLNDLIAEINEPLVECECCKGMGVIRDGN